MRCRLKVLQLFFRTKKWKYSYNNAEVFSRQNLTCMYVHLVPHGTHISSGSLLAGNYFLRSAPRPLYLLMELYICLNVRVGQFDSL